MREINITTIVSEEDIIHVAEQVASNFQVCNVPILSFCQSVEGLLKYVQTKPKLFALTFLDYKENPFPPCFHTYFLWGEPVHLPADVKELRDLDHAHYVQFGKFGHLFSSFLTQCDPRRYPSIEDLNQSIIKESESYDYARILASAKFARE